MRVLFLLFFCFFLFVFLFLYVGVYDLHNRTDFVFNHWYNQTPNQSPEVWWLTKPQDNCKLGLNLINYSFLTVSTMCSLLIFFSIQVRFEFYISTIYLDQMQQSRDHFLVWWRVNGRRQHDVILSFSYRIDRKFLNQKFFVPELCPKNAQNYIFLGFLSLTRVLLY